MQICVLGASRGIGRATVEYALSRGHSLRGVARSADKIDIPDDAFEPMAGDATDPALIAQAVDGMDAVVLTLGVPRSPKVLAPTTLFSDATQTLLPAMQAAGVRRLLTVTGFGAGNSIAKLSWIERLTMSVFLGRAYSDKTIQEDLIIGSSLDWTIARPGILTDNAMTGKYQVLLTPETWRQGMISRRDVAHFLVHAAEDGSYIHQTPALQR